jgi:hypothetical protein
VRRDLWRAAKALAAPTAALGVVAAFAPGRLGLALRVYALLLAAAALTLGLAALRRAYPPETPLLPRSAARRAGRRVPGPLTRLEQEVALGAAWSFDLHHRLRPRLRRLAAELLAARRGVSLDGAPEQARALLGRETWELVRADRPPPADRHARGIAAAELARAVESLERL